MKAAERMLRLPARPLADLLADLELLVSRRRQGEPVDIPRLTFWLAEGHRLQGELIRYSERDGLLLVKDAATLDATYLPFQQLRALTVHYNEDNLHTLSGGALLKLVGQAPGTLELKRRLQTLSETLEVTATVAFDEFPDTEEGRHVLGVALHELQGVLRQIVADPEGRESFNQVVAELQIRPSAQGPGVTRNGGVLLVLLGLEAGLVTTLSASKLKAALEKLL